MNVGVVGCGAIGSEICKAIDTDEVNSRRLNLGMELKFLIDHSPEKIETLCDTLLKKPEIVKTDSIGLSEILDEVDLVIESASQAAVREYLIPALKKRKDVMILSVGALLNDPSLFRDIKRISKEKGCRVYIPSGAIAGIDGLKAGAVGRIDSVELTTRKPLQAFEGNAYIRERGIYLSAIKEATTLFIGSAKDAVRHFPENVNIAATLCIACMSPGLDLKQAVGIGSSDTDREIKVKIVADPAAKVNSHEIEARGEFGDLFVRVRNVPSVANPKTSYLTSLSAIATLKEISSSMHLGR